ncbi:GbsR/MarR family transcriptional regulator [Nocardia mexicana]|uniref:MarR family protein n=1 Tax=Nocardia mexicana TaxID=279262 RepID=A0A370GYB2_9NOCA|nr:helix-turn-helix domain-containing protein [Nocardia mexicana]RDI46853.1 MarR family protein [Nocardia mexicana]
MPGGRLSQDDRRLIAAGLAERLGYAEIARRLGRPTSTVSREVTRNGGPGRYRPELAQAAAAVRSRRRTPRPDATEKYSGTDEYGRDPETLDAFSAGLAELFVQTGMPRTASAVLARLYAVDSGSLTATELVRHLGVSPATVSAAIGYLENQELIRRDRDANSRRERYILDESAWYRATLAGARFNELLSAQARDGAAALGPGTPAAARLLGMGEYLDEVGRDMIRSAEQWRTKLLR